MSVYIYIYLLFYTYKYVLIYMYTLSASRSTVSFHTRSQFTLMDSDNGPPPGLQVGLTVEILRSNKNDRSKQK